jgi:hypothetical protein
MGEYGLAALAQEAGRTSDEAFEPSTLADRARKAWLQAGLSPITLHEARHTYASLMAAAGVPLEDVADYMGHSTVEVTRKLYRHLYPDSRRRAADALEAFLEGAAEASEGKSKGKSASPQGGFQPARADQNTRHRCDRCSQKTGRRAGKNGQRGGAGIEPTKRRATTPCRF